MYVLFFLQFLPFWRDRKCQVIQGATKTAHKRFNFNLKFSTIIQSACLR